MLHPQSSMQAHSLRFLSKMTNLICIVFSIIILAASHNASSCRAFPIAAATKGCDKQPPPAFKPPPSSPPQAGQDRLPPFGGSTTWPFRGFNPFVDRAPLRGGRGGAFGATCERAPGVCGARGSPGPDCCGRACVNLAADPFNCGRCGRACRFGEMCCGGRCASVFFDRDNCGFCGNACRAGGFCRYGLCDYAV